MKAILDVIETRAQQLFRSSKAPSLSPSESLYCMAACNECYALLALFHGEITPREYVAKSHLPEPKKKPPVKKPMPPLKKIKKGKKK